MIPAIATSLDGIVGNVVSLRNANGAGRAYELFIMTGLAAELKSRGADVWVQRSDGTRIAAADLDRRFIQRGGVPTGVPASASGSGNSSSIVFRLSQSARDWEIWNGIQFTGRSRADHEIDIAIVPREVGRVLRASPGGGKPIGRPLVSIECKDVQAAGSPDEMRAFVARMYDLTVLNWHVRHLPHLPHPACSIGPAGHAPPYYSFWAGNRDTCNVLARRTVFAAGATAMTGYYGVRPRDCVTSVSPNYSALIVEIRDWIEGNLR